MGSYLKSNVLKKMLGIPASDSSQFDELNRIISFVENTANRELRNKLGFTNSAGNAVGIPLTATTRPELTQGFIEQLYMLAEARYRYRQSPKHKDMWDTALQEFMDFLDTEFGWTSSDGFLVNTNITVTPLTGQSGVTTLTISGQNFRKTYALSFYFNGVQQTTTPSQVITDSLGDFSGVTFVIPSGLAVGAYEVKIQDLSTVDANIATERVQVTS